MTELASTMTPCEIATQAARAIAALNELTHGGGELSNSSDVRAIVASLEFIGQSLPQLYEQLSRIYDHFDHKQISLVSGFRFAERNSSRHYHASAMDIRIPGVSINTMYAYAESLDQGGMGIGLYPTSQFIHVDFRAPGEPSYRWTDYSGHGGSKHHKKKKSTGRTHPARKTTS